MHLFFKDKSYYNLSPCPCQLFFYLIFIFLLQTKMYDGGAFHIIPAAHRDLLGVDAAHDRV
jgi:hypothetical protein